MLPDLVPFVRRQHLPQGFVRAQEAVEECGPILADPTRRFVEQEIPRAPGCQRIAFIRRSLSSVDR